MSTNQSQSVPETLRSALPAAEKDLAEATAAAKRAQSRREEKQRQVEALRRCIAECEGKQKAKANRAKRTSGVTKENLRPVVLKLINEKGQEGKIPADILRKEITELLKRRGIAATGLHSVLKALAKEFTVNGDASWSSNGEHNSA